MPPLGVRVSRFPVARAGAAWLLLLLAGLAPPLRAQEVSVARLEFDVRIDPPPQSLYVKATYHVRSARTRTILDFHLPAAVAARMDFRRVWDREGELSWRLVMADEGVPQALRVFLRAPLEPRRLLVLVVSYDLNLKEAGVPAVIATVEPDRARLATTGWYPLPTGSGTRLPLLLRLAVRLPKQWRVEAPVPLKQILDGTILDSYELELRRVRPDELLFRAQRPRP